MIKRLEIENYGCIRHAELKPTPMHAFVGPSDVGKSTVLKAIDALSRFINADAQRERDARAPMIPRKARDTLTLTVEFAGSLGFNVGFAPRSQTLESYVRESMQGEWLGYRHITPDFSWASEEPAAIGHFVTEIRQRLHVGFVALERAGLIADSPVRRAGASVMFGADGRGLAWVYEQLLHREGDAFDQITQRMRKRFPWMGGVEVSSVSSSAKTLVMRTLDGQRIPAEHVGEGFLRMLAWEALRYADRPRVLLVESPEAGLSPALVVEAMAILRELTVDKERPTQVLIATRSPLVLAELGAPEVTLVTRDPSEGTRVAALAEHPDYALRTQSLPRGSRGLDLCDGVMAAVTGNTVRTRI